MQPITIDRVTLMAWLRTPPAGDPCAILKTCRCGRTYTRTQWRALPYCGQIEDDPPLELRQCPCGSTIAIEVEVVPGHQSDGASERIRE